MSVRVSDGAHPQGHKGRLIDVRVNCTGEAGCATVLTILGEGYAISRHIDDDDLRLVILEGSIADALSRGPGVLWQAASGTMREISIALEEAESRDGASSFFRFGPDPRITISSSGT